MILALTGYMGCGKSTVGRIVADALGCPFTDLDDEVEKAAGRSIADIFTSDGEKAFRHLELQTLLSSIKKYESGNAVLALGGGTVTIPDAVRLLQDKTLCIWLKAPVEELQQRVAGSTRPLADDSFRERLLTREPLYAAAAHITLDTIGLSPEQIADEIIIDCL
ncbi:MAG: shikimate kinase [Bacteroidales bacterium]|nr:shikimate kinase [Bacteroidales bacterium]